MKRYWSKDHKRYALVDGSKVHFGKLGVCGDGGRVFRIYGLPPLRSFSLGGRGRGGNLIIYRVRRRNGGGVVDMTIKKELTIMLGALAAAIIVTAFAVGWLSPWLASLI
jgi:hypothetical protein